MSNTKFQNALNQTPQPCPPVWMMRQAGRYHSHYRNLRTKYSFVELCKIPEVAAEVALGPILDFDFDVSILFSDLLFPLDALGMGLTYSDKGPAFSWQISRKTVNQIPQEIDVESNLGFQKKALQITRELLPKDKSLIGFVGGIWTLFSYGVNGKHEGTLIEPKTDFFLQEKLFPILTKILIENIRLQLEGGAEVVMIFDTAAGELSPEQFNSIVIPFLKNITEKYPKKVGYYAKNMSRTHIEEILKIQELAGMGMDHREDIRSIFPLKHWGFLQGNFDPALLFLDKDLFKKQTKSYFEGIKRLEQTSRAGWVLGLGHGVLPGAPEENVREFVNSAREIFQ